MKETKNIENMDRETILNMLHSISTILDSMKVQIETIINVLHHDGACPHQHIHNLTTLGGGPEKYVCRDCGFEWEVPVEFDNE